MPFTSSITSAGCRRQDMRCKARLLKLDLYSLICRIYLSPTVKALLKLSIREFHFCDKAEDGKKFGFAKSSQTGILLIELRLFTSHHLNNAVK
jgi:hypothetical protein